MKRTSLGKTAGRVALPAEDHSAESMGRLFHCFSETAGLIVAVYTEGEDKFFSPFLGRNRDALCGGQRRSFQEDFGVCRQAGTGNPLYSSTGLLKTLSVVVHSEVYESESVIPLFGITSLTSGPVHSKWRVIFMDI